MRSCQRPPRFPIEQAEVQYGGAHCTPEKLVEAVEGAGFEASGERRRAAHSYLRGRSAAACALGHHSRSRPLRGGLQPSQFFSSSCPSLAALPCSAGQGGDQRDAPASGRHDVQQLRRHGCARDGGAAARALTAECTHSQDWLSPLAPICSVASHLQGVHALAAALPSLQWSLRCASSPACWTQRSTC